MTIEIKGYYFDIDAIKSLQKVGSNMLRVWFYRDSETIDIYMDRDERSEIILMWEHILATRLENTVSQFALAITG